MWLQASTDIKCLTFFDQNQGIRSWITKCMFVCNTALLIFRCVFLNTASPQTFCQTCRFWYQKLSRTSIYKTLCVKYHVQFFFSFPCHFFAAQVSKGSTFWQKYEKRKIRGAILFLTLAPQTLVTPLTKLNFPKAPLKWPIHNQFH